MNPYNPDPLHVPELERLRAVEAHRIRAARLAGVALMGGSAAIVIVAVLLVWKALS